VTGLGLVHHQGDQALAGWVIVTVVEVGVLAEWVMVTEVEGVV
jgi:hypothetical protein